MSEAYGSYRGYEDEDEDDDDAAAGPDISSPN